MTQMSQMDQRDPRTYAIIGAAMEVHNELGPGYLEAVYHEALAKELRSRGVPTESERPFVVHYKGEPLAAAYRADLICFGEVIVELKANWTTSEADSAQVINYLKGTRLATGLLLNFGEAQLYYRRFVLTHPASASAGSAPSAAK
jgi:GxxExxY protein